MAVGVSAAEQRCMAGRSARVGVVVVAFAEICSVIKKEAESAFAELVAITLQVVATELIDYDNDDQLGAGIVGRRKAQANEPDKEKSKDHAAKEEFHRAGSLQCGSYPPKTLNWGCRGVMWDSCVMLGHSIN